VEDASGGVHVVLRGKGEILTFDPNSYAPAVRRRVCKAPRGIAIDPTKGGLVVACLEGVLVELGLTAEVPDRVTFVDTDLRDVLFAGEQLVVTRFRSAEVLYLDAQRAITQRRVLTPPRAGVASTVAWRAIAGPDGSIVVVHQRSSTLVLEPSSMGAGGTAGSGGAGSAGGGTAGSAGTSPAVTYYGTGELCGGIVTAGVTVIDKAGNLTTSPDLGGAMLPVDIALAADGGIAIANGAYRGLRPYVLEYRREALTSSTLPCAFPYRARTFFGTLSQWIPAASAVAYEPLTGALLVHRRGRPALEIFDEQGKAEILLGDLAKTTRRHVAPLGYNIFHFDGQFGVSCASCHPEGTDDGHVWNFPKGPRKTQPLDVRLSGTEPFHWDGEFSNFGDLVHDILERRMGSSPRSAEDIKALGEYVYGFTPRPALRDPWDDAALRGQGTFEARCAGCHAGPTFTISESTDIGKGPPMQVPSLLGVGVRAPFMHDGCAKTLLDRFDPACGGALHGNVSDLDDAGRADLVAYLESL
jgi:hypothetical protein